MVVRVQAKVEKALRDEVAGILDRMGLDVPTAIRLYFNQIVVEQGLPFRPTTDSFYSSGNISRLKEAIKDIRAGRNLERHDLIKDD
ncbi:MAG: type II toxin-antitoxin system RelB/DinJ family antitoxin [Sutterellaceae bacterium]|nr:type II toxin-antitoxin system RelB/DinJ family antitoxin [Sutterellaceae bacterium]MDD7441237.1 type II toxin-antitoxin system RelB/DinJ family antitoxin [Sutterellaceae bacterium]MDY2869237.1 type II toxin-antitoxin system RelB/DinJ family antitoxin [Mesosutterella sp.]